MFRAQVVLDSISPEGHRLTTIRAEFPKYLQQEINTHKILSRSAASSRATPVESTLARLLGRAETERAPAIAPDPFVPLRFERNASGMQSQTPLTDGDEQIARAIWLSAMKMACSHAEYLHQKDIHKQFINRIVEPYVWSRCVLTGTEWANFFALRTHEKAEPHFRYLARAMWIAYRRSTPQPVNYGEWHLPFVKPSDRDEMATKRREIGGLAMQPSPDRNRLSDEAYYLARLSAARCARVSYAMHDRKKRPTIQDDLELWERLVGETPKHVGPLEHQATPFHPAVQAGQPQLRSNLCGWIQLRKLIPDENITRFEPSDREVEAWQIPEACLAPWGDEEV